MKSLHNEPIKQILNIIEQSPTQNLTVDMLADAAYMSASNLHLVFKKLTGQSLKSYIRGRKLTQSLNEIFNTNMRMIDIAQEYGFAHEQSFHRAFRSEFGCTPGQARKQRYPLKIRERIKPEHVYNIQDGLMYGPVPVLVPGFEIAGIPTLFKDFDMQRDACLPNQVGNIAYYNQLSTLPGAKHDTYIGYCDYSNPPDIEYIPSAIVTSPKHIPNGMKRITIPTQQFLRFHYIGKHHPDKITMDIAKETYYTIFHYLDLQQRYRFHNTYHFERIDEKDYDGVYCLMTLFYPMSDTTAKL